MKERIPTFIADEIIPMESDARQTAHGPETDLVEGLVAKDRAVSLLSPHAPQVYGGLCLDHGGVAVVFEEAGYSLLGSQSLPTQALDQGNVNLLEEVASEAQKKRWLEPLTAGGHVQPSHRAGRRRARTPKPVCGRMAG